MVKQNSLKVKLVNKRVTVIGAGLAGVEATWQLVSRQIPVTLVEMRPKKSTPAHQSANFGELVCSNSLRSNQINNAVGLLKEEMRQLNSLIIQTADSHQVSAGSALAVDREGFALALTDTISKHPLVTIVHKEVRAIPKGPTIIATGPLTADPLAKQLSAIIGEKSMYFYDAVAPIIEKDSINFDIAYYKSRYDKGEAAYINCPMDKQQFEAFYHELIHAKKATLREFEKDIYFEGCMPIEHMAKRGPKTLTFGPLKPVGLHQPDKRHYAVVQLRQDDAADTLYNMVGFQTQLTFSEQKRLIQMIPGLENANIVRYGVAHRNTYVNAPTVLKDTYQTKWRDDLFIAGQLSGVEGYVESAASGLLAGINMAKFLNKQPLIQPGKNHVITSMAHYIAHANPKEFVVMNANFGLVDRDQTLPKAIKNEAFAQASLATIKSDIL